MLPATDNDPLVNTNGVHVYCGRDDYYCIQKVKFVVLVYIKSIRASYSFSYKRQIREKLIQSKYSKYVQIMKYLVFKK